ncbi:pantetheine-phosphate adenylyltransferase [Mycoplasmopsis bovis]|uniref:pantetheine-phosphate adenylyltransferase n=1 Tax=Mycoplasmopsis bovis TaxID=28903 RepID=UPI001CF3BDF8|nr:pantetheine-phosphate adenylyltransferase [Mycoplasmopsis bovis]MCA8845728.1 pantetheine-phosphate adenylyltransferase [Mycoplasmopsis bovis]MCA8848786.1 pantetheine-phosphate adenylyltransferase [Mycoplasmopsis bovis]MCA8851875.1 pantetheine-phosphate adenylyltransferase [Mycoplasmopsis bovis]MCA8854530.1 pantetheine-phosphate adenylyltransferase [Mycoplasmopsis bovis]MCA8855774.1 pantetheine-phosphate adenylyltransferase [Mycoplasmopsis bovis]
MKTAIYPGSFDPLHEGHIAIVKKALKIFDKLFVIVSVNPDKERINDIDTRFAEAKMKLKDFKNVDVLVNKNELIAEMAKKLGANFLIRSARNDTDFKYELTLAAGHNSINNDLETILIMPDYNMIEYSSTVIRHKQKLGK